MALPLLDTTDEVTVLVAALVRGVPLPARSGADALHIAVAACHGMDFLVTWNCTHIANAELRPLVERVCHERGYVAPVLCAPDELNGRNGRWPEHTLMDSHGKTPSSPR